MNPQVSIIVPVYNSARYLDACINSVVNQTFTDWELLLIDDGSTDSSAKICSNWKDRDSRVKCIQKPNGGVSSARNMGLAHAIGKYIMFVDSDDCCANRILEILHHSIQNEHDIVACRVTGFKGEVPAIPLVDTVSEQINTIDNLYIKYGEAGLLHPPVAKLYKTDIIRKYNIRFDETLSLGEDLCFNLDYLDHVSSGSLIDSPLYLYRDTTGSLSKRIKDDYADIQMYLLDRKFRFIDEHNIQFDYRPMAPGIVRDIFLSLCKSDATDTMKRDSINRLKQHRIMGQCRFKGKFLDELIALSIRIIPPLILIKFVK